MTKITVFNLKSLSNDDAYGFLNEAARHLNDACRELPKAGAEFIAALSQYNEVLKGEDISCKTADLYAADEKADEAWSGLNQYLKAMLNCPDDEMRLASERVWGVFSKYENPTNKPFSTEYGIIERLLEDLNSVPEEIRTKANAQLWIDHLTQCSEVFTTMYRLRVQEQASRVTGATKAAKVNAIDAYREMVSVINALMVVAPTEELTLFVTHLNQLIDDKKTVLKARKTRSAHAAAEEPEDV